jgi:16S rRNA (uracil1498-N3)-methyltransferase
MRHPRGSGLVVFDGRGLEARATLADVDGVAVVTVTEQPRPAAPAAPLHLVWCLPKGPAQDTALRMAVETGVTHLHPALSRRTVARGDHPDRWERVMVAAARQCGRADVPLLHPLAPLDRAAAAVPEGVDRRVALPGEPPMARATGPAALVVGPEGGLDEREVEDLLAAGWVPGGLSSWVLRADTAVAVGLAALAPLG